MKTAREWHKAAAAAIEKLIAEQLERDPKLRDDADALFQRVGHAYPFARKPPQLAAWKEQIRIARIDFMNKLAANASAINRPCPVCRAAAGQACISVGENDNLAAEFHAAAGQHNAIRGNKAPGRVPQTLKESVMHDARRDPDAPIVTSEVVGAA